MPISPISAPLAHCFVRRKPSSRYSISAESSGAEPIEITVPTVTPARRIEA